MVSYLLRQKRTRQAFELVQNHWQAREDAGHQAMVLSAFALLLQSKDLDPAAAAELEKILLALLKPRDGMAGVPVLSVLSTHYLATGRYDEALGACARS